MDTEVNPDGADPTPDFPFTPPPGSEPVMSNPEVSAPAPVVVESTPRPSRPWLWWSFVTLVIATVCSVASFYVISDILKAWNKGLRPVETRQSVAVATPISWEDTLQILRGTTREIHVVSPSIASTSFLDELIAAQRRGCQVIIYTDTSEAAVRTLKYLRKNEFPVDKNVFGAKTPITENFVVVDQLKSITGSSGFTTPLGKQGYSLYIDKAKAHEYVATMRALVIAVQ